MFDYETGYYEYNYRTLREAQEAKKQAGKGAKITTFLSTNENMEIVTIYKLTFKALGYEVPKISDFSYIKYDCIEWMGSHELKITVQRSGEWLQVVEKRAHVHPVRLFCDYQAGKYITRY